MSQSFPGRPAGEPLEPDAHGQAALLLVESLIHTLVETRTLTAGQAVLTVNAASDIKAEVAAAAGESTGRMQASLALLAAIAASLETDGPAAANDAMRP